MNQVAFLPHRTPFTLWQQPAKHGVTTCELRRPHAVLAHTHNKCRVHAAEEVPQNGPVQPARKKRGRKSSLENERSRVRNREAKRPLLAKWSGVVLAQSNDYEFVDGRFFFPSDSVEMQFLEQCGKTRHINPIGKADCYDIVVRIGKDGRKVLRNRNAAWKFKSVKNPWNYMMGYVGFWKGVKIVPKPAPIDDLLDLENEDEDLFQFKDDRKEHLIDFALLFPKHNCAS